MEVMSSWSDQWRGICICVPACTHTHTHVKLVQKCIWTKKWKDCSLWWGTRWLPLALGPLYQPVALLSLHFWCRSCQSHRHSPTLYTYTHTERDTNFLILKNLFSSQVSVSVSWFSQWHGQKIVQIIMLARYFYNSGLIAITIKPKCSQERILRAMYNLGGIPVVMLFKTITDRVCGSCPVHI